MIRFDRFRVSLNAISRFLLLSSIYLGYDEICLLRILGRRRLTRGYVHGIRTLGPAAQFLTQRRDLVGVSP